ncbi:nucleoside hydrolase [Mucisphaera calidilacus]|uniref:Inosine-uridine preferring nucleoside hydrolase n=1 Tax=Mucisphaera calidilacus TaxID=2527982 RepID=A0A518BYV4_9BACT|nr:nucleoside hydrolase [Mucisphaera calidilacus]QDU72157.1 Inosine-uridine preferring nucleoside hydrolase [Mucisphaera calidilacus]
MDAERLIPELPAEGHRLRVVIDSDVANEIDDLYAIALALRSPERFRIEGLIATHFAAAEHAGSDSTERSYALMMDLLAAAGESERYACARGGHPFSYPQEPPASEGADLIIDRARRASPSDPLWVVVLGAATNVAGAILRDPTICPSLRVVFHARCPELWPERTRQFNVCGDVIAARHLLASEVPLVWFDTGTELTQSLAESASRLRPIDSMGAFIHDYRCGLGAWARRDDKGIFDLADVAWMIDPSLCRGEVVPAPKLLRGLEFDWGQTHGSMLRVTQIDTGPTWDLFYRQLCRDRVS